MLSIFYIVLGNPKNVITASDIFTQIDKILPRESSIKNFWKDNTNQDSIWVEVFEGQDEVEQIGIRFDTESSNEDFKNNIIDFATRNHFLLTIKQEVSFQPVKLNEK